MNLFERAKHGLAQEYWSNTTVEEATNDAIPLYLRFRGLAIFLGIDSVFAFATLLTNYPEVAHVFIAPGALYVAYWYTKREAIRREIGLFWRLHQLAENFRSEGWKLASPPQDNEHDVEIYAMNYINFNQTVVDDIATFFRKLLNDDSACCAIRLLHPSESQAPEVNDEQISARLVFKTIARSSGLSKDRGRDSEDLQPDEGIALALRSRKNSGVYVIRDFEKAEVWKVSPNDARPDIRKLLVAPINQCESDRKQMLGMLFVTTAEGDFKKRHVEPLKAFADLLGFVYPLITHEVWFAAQLGGTAASGGNPSVPSSTGQRGVDHG